MAWIYFRHTNKYSEKKDFEIIFKSKGIRGHIYVCDNRNGKQSQTSVYIWFSYLVNNV